MLKEQRLLENIGEGNEWKSRERKRKKGEEGRVRESKPCVRGKKTGREKGGKEK